MKLQILCVVGPTASGKSARAIEEALRRSGEIISVDSRQVYRGLDIGTEKISVAEMRDVPHHLIDIRDVRELYSAGDFVTDATRLISEISARGKLPILVGGTYFYFDALLNPFPLSVEKNQPLRDALTETSTEDLYAQVQAHDPRRATALDPANRRRIIRALEIITALGHVPERSGEQPYAVNWIVINPSREELRARIDARLTHALERGLVAEVERIRAVVGDERLDELGLEYRIVGEFLRGERSKDTLFPTLSAKLWQYARRQKAWLRKLGHAIN